MCRNESRRNFVTAARICCVYQPARRIPIRAVWVVRSTGRREGVYLAALPKFSRRRGRGGTIMQGLAYKTQVSMCCSSSPDTSGPSLSLASSDSALSRPVPRMAKEAAQPNSVIPAKRPHASASPLGLTRVDKVKRPPDRNGPTLRPAAERVCASPLSVPRFSREGAELVISESVSGQAGGRGGGRLALTRSMTLLNPPTAQMFLSTRVTPNSP